MNPDQSARDAEAYDHRHPAKGGATIHDHIKAGRVTADFPEVGA